jgi:hypothetical protein
MSVPDVIELRALLSEKFPGLRMRLKEPGLEENKCWPTGLPQMDGPLRGGLLKGALTEIVSGKNRGSSMLIHALLRNAARENQIIALIDGSDSLDVTQIEEDVLSRLFWIRCRSAETSLKAADLVLRDGNLNFVLLDLNLNTEKQLRKIPATYWYRFQRLVESTGTVCVLLTPHPMVSPAQARIRLRPQYSIAALDRDFNELLAELKVEVFSSRQFSEKDAALQMSA